MKLESSRIAVIGLGYVGLPLSVAFAKKYRVVGFDVNQARVDELLGGNDLTRELDSDELNSVLSCNLLDQSAGLTVTSNPLLLQECNIFIVAVPTPTDKNNRPVLTPMIKASETVAVYLNRGDIVIYESTVYPGVTEDEMVPVLEDKSGLKYNVDFFCGYSPERINPGDKEHTVTNIMKVTSGSTPEVAEFIDQLYKTIIDAGTFKTSSIKIAEAAKVIENAQRDINIAFMNELSVIFRLLEIDTNEVLEAAGTKWNFLKFKPGIVGGHCIGVDPYYLAQKAQEMGYHPEIILAGRRLNDSMGKYIATEVVKLMIKKSLKTKEAKILILGFSFKENCPDFRNTKVVDIYNELLSYGAQVDIFDPLVNSIQVKSEYNIDVFYEINRLNIYNNYTAIILAVAHDMFLDLNLKTNSELVVFDVKGVLPVDLVDARL